ncbi:hypothetical protein BPO_2434 [Bergeyella porcorum]|uniref:Secreted protein n=1 Tax=Bergeyella porcorum TaxID=1735111 RepID=A0AAU0F546_9FLAO
MIHIPIYFFLVVKLFCFLRGWYRVVALASPRVASGNPPYAQPKSSEQTVLPQGSQHIVGTSGLIPAILPQ